MSSFRLPVATLALAALCGCASRAVDVAPLPTSPAEFLAWDCGRIDDEIDDVQQRAVDVAYAVDERVGNNIIALSVGVAVFWPAMFAMRPGGLEAADLARLKGRYEALKSASRHKDCPPVADVPSPTRSATLQLAQGELLVYEDRVASRGPAAELALRLTALRRGDIEFHIEGPTGGLWRQDRSGNILAAPRGALQWPHLLRSELALGGVTAGDIVIAGDPLARARMRGQVVAVGPQIVAGRRFDVAVVELFGDALRSGDSQRTGDHVTRVDGAIVVDRVSGVLLRLDLRSANEHFSLQRRLVRVEPAPPP